MREGVIGCMTVLVAFDVKKNDLDRQLRAKAPDGSDEIGMWYALLHLEPIF